MSEPIQIIPIEPIPMVAPGDDVADLIVQSIEAGHEALRDHDVLVVCSKIIAKAEHQIVRLDDVTPGAKARRFAETWGKDPILIEIVLGETSRVVRMERGILIGETRHGFVCANAGVDRSNVDGGPSACLLPQDPNASARRLRHAIGERYRIRVAVIISDSFGRPWRLGQTDVAVGLAGLTPLEDFRGQSDRHGFELNATQHAIADAMTAAAGLHFRKASGVAACIVRNCYYFDSDDGRATDLVRKPHEDLFR